MSSKTSRSSCALFSNKYSFIRLRVLVEHFYFILQHLGVSGITLDALISDDGKKTKNKQIIRLQKAVYGLCDLIGTTLTSDKELEKLIKDPKVLSNADIMHASIFSSLISDMWRFQGGETFLATIDNHFKKQTGGAKSNTSTSKESSVVQVRRRNFNDVNTGAVSIYAPPRTDPTQLAFREPTTLGALTAAIPRVNEINRNIAEGTLSLVDGVSQSDRDRSAAIVTKLQENKLENIAKHSDQVDEFIAELQECRNEGSDMNIFVKQQIEEIRDMLKKKLKVDKPVRQVKQTIERDRSTRNRIIVKQGIEMVVTLGALGGAYYYYLTNKENKDCSKTEGLWESAGCYSGNTLGYLNPANYARDAVGGIIQYVMPGIVGMTLYRTLQNLFSFQSKLGQNTAELNSALKELLAVYNSIIEDNIDAIETQYLAQLRSLQLGNKKIIPALLVYLQGDNIQKKAKDFVHLAIERVKLHYQATKFIITEDRSSELSDALAALHAKITDQSISASLLKFQRNMSEHSVVATATDLTTVATRAARGAMKVATSGVLGKKKLKSKSKKRKSTNKKMKTKKLRNKSKKGKKGK